MLITISNNKFHKNSSCGT